MKLEIRATSLIEENSDLSFLHYGQNKSITALKCINAISWVLKKREFIYISSWAEIIGHRNY